MANDIVQISVEGEGELIGPNLLPLNAGQCGFWIKSKGCQGNINIKVINIG